MSSIGPELPAHLLAKRKHEEEEETKRNASNESRLPLLSSPQSASKRRRVLGPAPPPAPLDQKPAKLPSDSDKSSSEDEYGPVVASKDVGPTKSITAEQTWNSIRQPNVELERKSGRDEWMLVPPTQDDLSARMDPTKLKARKFNTGKGAKSAGQFDVDNTMWTETPEQKRKRLRDQVLGVQEISSTDVEAIGVARKQKEDEEKARKVWEYDVKYRGKTLVEQHRAVAAKEKEDDPSKRAFDYEKDMGSAAQIGHAQKREMLKRAADLGSKFSKGSFL